MYVKNVILKKKGGSKERFYMNFHDPSKRLEFITCKGKLVQEGAQSANIIYLIMHVTAMLTSHIEYLIPIVNVII